MDDHYPSCFKQLRNRWEIIVERKASCRKQFPDGQTDFFMKSIVLNVGLREMFMRMCFQNELWFPVDLPWHVLLQQQYSFLDIYVQNPDARRYGSLVPFPLRRTECLLRRTPVQYAQPETEEVASRRSDRVFVTVICYVCVSTSITEFNCSESQYVTFVLNI